jgi:hypothetical protein
VFSPGILARRSDSVELQGRLPGGHRWGVVLVGESGGERRRLALPLPADDQWRPGELRRLGQGRAVVQLEVATLVVEGLPDWRSPHPS